MAKLKNVLWIMADQLRYDYLSCYGHKTLHTPNIDRLAAMGVKFNRTYVQSPICGPSRMSFYTGRYVRSHGSTWNGFPLRVGEPTLGDHLRELGVRCSLVGKTHMVPDAEGMKRLGIEPESVIGNFVRECGFEPYERDDGLHPTALSHHSNLAYNEYLRAHGMGGENPWEDWANSAEGPDGEILSGWYMQNAHLPARVPAEHSETTYMMNRGIDFMEEAEGPWLCHLSFIKPHWPYMAPAPYNDMYSAKDLPPVVRTDEELRTDHPFLKSWQETRVSECFSRDDVRDRVAPVYMGLIKQLDDEMGRLLDYLEKSGRLEDTMIVFTSDHGDNMGDHWLGEKDLFYDCSARIPLIIYDPRPEADSTRGTSTDLLAEGIDLAATFVECFGGNAKPHILEGRSLMPIIEDRVGSWRKYAISEYDYSTRSPRRALDVDEADARLIMVFDGRWKYIHCEGFRPMLFDLETDPGEVVDLGAVAEHEQTRERLRQEMDRWSRTHHNRITISKARIEKLTDIGEPPGILIGYWDAPKAENSDTSG
ncbi:alkaline phosphatase family protein [Martelella soudanensis]|uniref:alkaline phosphatase family protein n=1 Tax=unclassified Martelella TaxID=2629616 RepID=UPI0015DF6EEA|nr:MULTISPECIES: alkaline phosphatase family protein [unclassified Martelella]